MEHFANINSSKWNINKKLTFRTLQPLKSRLIIIHTIKRFSIYSHNISALAVYKPFTALFKLNQN